MKFFNIDKIVNIYMNECEKASWHTPAPRPVHHLAYDYVSDETHVINGKKYEIRSGTLMFLHKDIPYDVYSRTNSKSPCIAFTGEVDCESFYIDCTNLPQIRKIFERLIAHKNIEDDGNRFFCMSEMYKLFSIINSLEEKKYHNSGIRNKIKKAYDYIEENYTQEEITNKHLAELCNLSERRFTTLFKEIYGNTPRQYIIEKRLSFAALLLKTEIYSISQIAKMSGFPDVYSFSHSFKKVYSVSPAEYKKD
ncbi:MAG: helix-turn-helix domain-containing protein [Ruminococcaceae bacterium]|nr:helix-turn-helix domain-containing protein [Oscillospiraceae bacterium]